MSTPPDRWVRVGSIYVPPDDPRLRSHAGSAYLSSSFNPDTAPMQRAGMIVQCAECVKVRHGSCARRSTSDPADCLCFTCWTRETLAAWAAAVSGGYPHDLIAAGRALELLVLQRKERRKRAELAEADEGPRYGGPCPCGCGRQVVMARLGRRKIYATESCRTRAYRRRKGIVGAPARYVA
jgi:hypothetical protein